MIDGSRLPLEENIAVTRSVVELARARGVAVEAELGAVLGHEKGPLPPYEELFRTGRGFTRVEEAERFVRETGVDWLSVSVGNIHGAISEAARDKKKLQARIDIAHLSKLKEATGLPLVLHGGSGIEKSSVLEAIKNGIAKINIGTEIRQAYESALKMRPGDTAFVQEAVAEKVRWMISEYFGIEGSAGKLL
jgi:fructose/tagatose bisphosphate aldolase